MAVAIAAVPPIVANTRWFAPPDRIAVQWDSSGTVATDLVPTDPSDVVLGLLTLLAPLAICGLVAYLGRRNATAISVATGLAVGIAVVIGVAFTAIIHLQSDGRSLDGPPSLAIGIAFASAIVVCPAAGWFVHSGELRRAKADVRR